MASYSSGLSADFAPLRALPAAAGFRRGDVLVVFGELFSRGYANGIVDEAERAGLTVVRSTVGRRDEQGQLRPLNEEELKNQPKPFINIPLEAGFDLEPCDQDGSTPVSQLAGVKMSEWENAKLDWDKVKSSRANGVARFRKHVAAYMLELEKQLENHIAKGANVIFAHTMAGGVPRAKIIMPTMNRVVKGVGDRHLSSEKFWQSDLGRLSEMSFEEVTANTLSHFIELTEPLRKKIASQGGTSRFVAFGYHGTEVLVRGEYRWQTYSPYVQGWAKLKLENIAKEAFASGIATTVYNCPEILTNSTTIFVGVEVPLYPFIESLKKETKGKPGEAKTNEVLAKCQALLKDGTPLSDLTKVTDAALSSEEIRRHCDFNKWPQHNGKEQMETLISASETLVEMHKDPKNLITFILSEEIFRATGNIMFNDCWKPQKPVLWLGHDVLAKALATGETL